MKMKCCWALLSALVFLTAMATFADGCSCSKRHPQEHYCSADFGTVLLSVFWNTLTTNQKRPFKLNFFLSFFFLTFTQLFWLTLSGSCTIDPSGLALTRYASRRSSKWLNPDDRPCRTGEFWRLHTTPRAVSDSSQVNATCWRATSAPANLGSTCATSFTIGTAWRPSSVKVSVVSTSADAIARSGLTLLPTPRLLALMC